MKMNTLLLVAVIAMILFATATARLVNSFPNAKVNKNGKTSVPISRHPHHFIPNAVRGTDRKSVGTSIPMNGGLLNYGAFFVNLTVSSGANAQTFNTIVDTGSSNTAIPSYGCKTCGTTHLYNPLTSPTAKKLGCSTEACLSCTPAPIGGADQFFAPKSLTNCPYGNAQCRDDACVFSITYGGGGTATAGNIGTEYACLGEKCGTIYLDRILDQYPAATQPGGILGLAFPANACNPTCQDTILDSFVNQGVIEKQDNLFGMCLTAYDGGVIDLGWYDENRYHGELQYTPVVKEHWYNIGIESMMVENSTLNVPPFYFDIRNDAIGSFVDSGTSVVLISPYAFQELSGFLNEKFVNLKPYLSALLGGQCTAIPSSEVANFPKISFMVKGAGAEPSFPVSMTGKDYLMETAKGSGEYCLGIAGVPSIGLIMGDVIMQNYYIVFDRVNARLGFAPIKQC